MIQGRIIERLQKVLALTSSPVEGEAQAAAAMLQKLLTEHNLDIADLERRGQQKPRVEEGGHDLGKAAFNWKLNLAEGIAEHYYCAPLVDRKKKTVAFVGRPDNVEALQMLYAWLIDQVKRIATEERRRHIETTNDHIDPLRWQINFGEGATTRLIERLREMKTKREYEQTTGDAECTALVKSHAAEVSDYLEEKFGYRVDGKLTKKEQESEKRWAEYIRQSEERQRKKEQLLKDDPDEYYRQYPHETAEAKARQAEEDAKYWAKEAAKERRNAARRKGTIARWKPETEEQRRKREQGNAATVSGRKAAERVNIEPFLGEGKKKGELA